MSDDSVPSEDGTGSRTARALVIREDASPGRAHESRQVGSRPLADFIAQLIACDRRYPTYRQARRAEPSRAASAYADVSTRPQTYLDTLV